MKLAEVHLDVWGRRHGWIGCCGRKQLEGSLSPGMMSTGHVPHSSAMYRSASFMGSTSVDGGLGGG